MSRRLTILLALVGILALSASSASAALVLTLDDLSTVGIDVIVVDGSPVGTATALGPSTVADGSATAGVVFFSGGVGVFSVNITSGLSKPAIGAGSLGKIDLNSVDVSGSGGTLELMLTDTGFLTGPVINVGILGLIGGTTNGTVDYQAWLDPANAEFGMGPGTITTGLQSFTTGAFSGTFPSNGALVTPPVSLTQWVSLTHGASGVSSFNAELTIIPEPATIVIWSLLGSLGIVVAWRRRRKAA